MTKSACPTPKQLHSFLAGETEGEERLDVAEHASRCDLCYAVIKRSVAATPGRRGLGWLAVAALALSAAGGAYYAREQGLFLSPTERAMLPLVKAVGERRFFEPRLTGGFRYGTLLTASRAGAAIASDWSLMAVGGRLAADLSSPQQAAAAHAILGDFAGALDRLEEIATPDPATRSDLSAILLARAIAEERDEDLPRALEIATAAARSSPGSPEALYNRALALELLMLPRQAHSAWAEALAVTEEPGWRAEIETRLSATPPQGLDLETHGQRIQLALKKGDSTEVERLVAESVEAARVFLEEVLMEEASKGNPSGRSSDFALFGEAFERVTGDTVAREAFAASSATGPDPDQAAILSAFSAARRAHRKTRWDDAERLLAAVEPLMAKRQHPLSGWTSLWLAVQERQRGNMDSSRSRLRGAIRFSQARGQPGLEARARYNLSVIDEVQGRWDSALAERERALLVLTKARDLGGSAYVAQQAAQLWSLLGRHRIGWERRRTALREAWRIPDPNRRILVFNLVGDDCLRARQLACAAAFYEEALHLAVEFGDSSTIADTLLGQAVALAPSDAARAAEKLSHAQQQIDRVDDQTLRLRLEGEAIRATAEVEAASPNPTLQTIDRALDWMASQSSPGKAVPLRVEKARLLEKAGQIADARRELNAVLHATPPPKVSDSQPVPVETRVRSLLLGLDLKEASGPVELLEAAERVWTGSPDQGDHASRSAVLRLRQATEGRDCAVAFLFHEGRLLRFFVSDGEVQFLMTPVSQASFALYQGRLIRALRAGKEAAEGRVLSDMLFASLPLTGKRTMAVIGDPVVLSTPLGSLPLGGQTVGDFVDLTLATSVSSAVRRTEVARLFDQALVVGVNSALSQGLRLSSAEREARAVAEALNVTPLDVVKADGSHVASLLEEATLFHFAGHALVDPDRPGNSRLVMTAQEGRPADLTARDIARLPLRHLQLAFLSACTTSVLTADASEPISGLAAAFLEAGTRRVIATLWPVSDAGMEDLARRIYPSLRRGASVAAAVAEQARDRQRPVADAAALVVYGPL